MICSSGCDRKRRCARTRTAPIGFWLRQSRSVRPLQLAQCAHHATLGETHPQIRRPLEEARPKGCAARARFRAGVALRRARRRDWRRYQGARSAPLAVRTTARQERAQPARDDVATRNRAQRGATVSLAASAFGRAFARSRPRLERASARAVFSLTRSAPSGAGANVRAPNG
jgi:hypothetical protein